MIKLYGELTSHFPSSPRLAEAVSYVTHIGHAIDIGAGSLRNSRYLEDKGFTVTAIDIDEGIVERAHSMGLKNTEVYVEDMKTFRFPVDTFDIAVAVRSISFVDREHVLGVIEAIKRSLVRGGVLYITFFGDKDGWVGAEDKSFFSKEEVLDVIGDMEVLMLTEKEKDSVTIRGAKKHWHTLEAIVKKK